jgi:hypothetical protein
MVPQSCRTKIESEQHLPSSLEVRSICPKWEPAIVLLWHIVRICQNKPIIQFIVEKKLENNIAKTLMGNAFIDMYCSILQQLKE